MRVLVFDTETGGLDASKHSILTLGALAGDLDTGEVFEQFEAFHKLPSVSDYVISDGAFGVHGITPEECMERGITTQEIQERFADLYMNHNCVLLGGHNVEFDVRMMCHQIYKFSVSEFDSTFTYRKLDSMPIVRLFAGVENMQQGATLKQTVKSLGIDMSDIKGGTYHAALYDVIATFRVLCKFRSVLSDPSVVSALTK
jgi:DNA polymerase III alpha subunit (gram-positive type)